MFNNLSKFGYIFLNYPIRITFKTVKGIEITNLQPPTHYVTNTLQHMPYIHSQNAYARMNVKTQFYKVK